MVLEFGVANRAGAGVGRNRREERGPIEPDLCPRFPEPRLRDPQILVGRFDLRFERIEVRIAEDRPPLTARQVIARVRQLPAFRLLV